MKKSHILCLILLISCISLTFKLYLADFDSPVITEDTYGYVLRAISISNGDFSESPRKTLGWSMFISPFISLNSSNDFLSYLNTAQYLSIGISLIAIFAMYLLSRRFFNEKYSLVAASLFAFEPHLNYNSVFGLSEPIFILLIILSAYLILQKNSNFAYLSFLTVGLLWWVRFNGIITALIISVIFFMIHRISPKSIIKYGLCILVFLVIVSPMLIQRNDQYGDPLYFSQGDTFFLGDYSAILAENTSEVDYGALDYIEDNGIVNFLDKFLLTGFFNLLGVIYKLSFPYLIVLLPFGILFSLRAFDQNSNFIKGNWIFIIISLSIFVIYFAIVPEKRLIYHILPFIIILSTITIQRFVKYGLSTFSFSTKQKNYSLISIIGIIIILSSVYTSHYEISDNELVQEKLQFSKILLDKFDGKILDAGDTLRLVKFTKLNSSEFFKEYRTSQQDEFFDNYPSIHDITLHASSIEELITIGKENNLKFISVNRDGVNEMWYPYLSELYVNHNQYPFLIEVLDTKELNYKKFHIKVFEINYDSFHYDKP